MRTLRRLVDRWWGRVCRDRPWYADRARAQRASRRLHAAGARVEPYRCVLCALLGRDGWHLTSRGADEREPAGWGPLL